MLACKKKQMAGPSVCNIHVYYLCKGCRARAGFVPIKSIKSIGLPPRAREVRDARLQQGKYSARPPRRAQAGGGESKYCFDGLCPSSPSASVRLVCPAVKCSTMKRFSGTAQLNAHITFVQPSLDKTGEVISSPNHNNERIRGSVDSTEA